MKNDPLYNPDDPAQPIRPPASSSQQGQQGKLILGSFQDAQNSPGRTERRPYQNPSGSSQRPRAYPQQPNQQGQPVMPNPQVQRYPYSQPEQFAGSSPPKQKRRPRRRRGCLVGCLVVLVLLAVVGGFTFTTAQRVLAFGSAISTQAPLSTQTGYLGTSDRVNLLVMGYGGGTHDGANLTDSLVVMSLLPQSHHTSLVSVPRDLWIQYPPQSGQYTKINAVYELASNNGKDVVAGGNAAAQKVSLVTGVDVKYWMTINFAGFRELIDSLGGIDVYVPDSFNACYPKNDDAAKDPSWIKVQFNKGMQHMNGATAITYARAREPLEVCGKGTSENLAELTDFGRSARQQIIIKAVLAKVKQASTWPKLFDAMTALQHTIYTNMSLADLTQFALKMDLNDPHTAHVGLSNQNVLMDSIANDGGYILVAKNNDWQAIIDYVKQHLYS